MSIIKSFKLLLMFSAMIAIFAFSFSYKYGWLLTLLLIQDYITILQLLTKLPTLFTLSCSLAERFNLNA